MKNQKKIMPVLAMALAMATDATAALLYQWNGPAQPIPDNNPSGLAFGFTLPGLTPSMTAISDVSVSFNVSGGWNGDLYAYLSHGSGMAVLLNRVGVGATTPGASANGYGDAGFNLTLSSAGAANVHFYQNYSPTFSNGQLTGTWQPDGRGIAPDSPDVSFDAPGTADFNTFLNQDPHGDWTLFFADVSTLGTATLNGFSVGVVAVPEPVNMALGLLALLSLGVQVCRVARRSPRPSN
jgi:hypothetical protein